MKKVSVIIPVFNTEKYIEECLMSVLSQTLKDIEVICINDGSTDHSLEILKDFRERDDRVTVLDQLNEGQSSARNKALSLATGKYIYFMDSDDLITSQMLEELYTMSEEKNLDILYFSGTSFYETDELAKKHKGFSNTYFRKGNYPNVLDGIKMFSKLSVNKDYFVSPCLQFIRREFLEEKKVRFYEGIIHEDNCFTFETLLQAERVSCVNDIYFYRRVRTASVMTNEENYRNLKGYFCCLMKQLRFAGELKIDDVEANMGIAHILSMLNYHVKRIYMKLPKAEKEKFINECSSYERYLFDSLILSSIKIQKSDKEKIQSLNKQLKKIKKSRTYRIGKIFTYPVWLIKGGIKCWRQHGMIYTWKLIVKKVCKKIQRKG